MGPNAIRRILENLLQRVLIGLPSSRVSPGEMQYQQHCAPMADLRVQADVRDKAPSTGIFTPCHESLAFCTEGDENGGLNNAENEAMN